MYFGLGQISENDIHAEIAGRGIRIEEPVIEEPVIEEPVIEEPWEPREDEFPITPIIVTPPPVTTIPFIPTVSFPPEDDLIDDLIPEEEEKKAFVLSRNTLIALGIGTVVVLALVGSRGPERRALAPPARRALPRAGPTAKRVIVDV